MTNAVASSTVRIGGREIARAGFGAARLTAGDGWGEPADRGPARHILESALALGIDYVDTADVLGPGVSESIIGEVIGASGRAIVATKAGMLHYGERQWGVLGRPDYLKQQAYASRARLRVETIDLFYLHRIDPSFPLADQIGALQELRAEGVIREIGVSEPTPEQFEAFIAIERPAAVQSRFNIAQRENLPVLTRAEELGIPFVAYWPLIGHAIGLPETARSAVFGALEPAAARLGATTSQLALAWLVSRSPATVPIFGTRSPEHLAQNVAATRITLDPVLVDELERVVDEALLEVGAAAAQPGGVR